MGLSERRKDNGVVTTLTSTTNQALAGIGQVLPGESLKLLFPDPLIDPAVPDIIVVANTGVNYEPTATSTTLAEHVDFGEHDTHVPLIVFTPHLSHSATVLAPVFTIKIAPTGLSPLHLQPNLLPALPS